jgi:hypothetical protein
VAAGRAMPAQRGITLAWQPRLGPAGRRGGVGRGQPQATASAQAGRRAKQEECDRVVLRTLPKVVFLYPTLIAAIIAGLITSEWSQHGTAVGVAFLIVAFFNFLVLSFDFPRTTWLTAVFFILALILGGVLVNERWTFLPFLRRLTGHLEPRANSHFYGLFAFGLIAIYLVVLLLDMRLDYWELRPQELIHHHGLLGNLSRYPAPGLELQKEITDVFEFLLLRSGRLVIQPNRGPTIILENVPNINKRERDIKTLLDALSVEITGHDHVHDDL